MTIEFIKLSCFRNLESFEFSPSKSLNLIHGQNASGKTSLLESLFYLSRARSFRTSNTSKLVSYGQDTMSVFARLNNEGRKIPIGIQKSGSKQTLRIDSENVNKISEMSEILPLQIIHPESHRLIEGGPVFRRQFLDWGVFHVEHGFFAAWNRYRQALKQRNAALREPKFKGTFTSWNAELCESGEIINQYRKNYVTQLESFVPKYLNQLIGTGEYGFKYLSGWGEDLSFDTALDAAASLDQSRGFTTVGPHRADLKISLDGRLIEDRISRGQQKILISTLLMAQAIFFESTTKRVCVLLIDDIAAELDSKHRSGLIEVLSEFKLQLFVSSINPTKEWDNYYQDKETILLD